VFAGAAHVFEPFSSRAQQGPDGPLPALVRKDGSLLIGRALGRDHRLVVYASADGVRYTVMDARGRILGSDLTGEDLYRTFPDLDPSALHAERAGKALMMVDPDR
jgi:hypothetical protein